MCSVWKRVHACLFSKAALIDVEPKHKSCTAASASAPPARGIKRSRSAPSSATITGPAVCGPEGVCLFWMKGDCLCVSMDEMRANHSVSSCHSLSLSHTKHVHAGHGHVLVDPLVRLAYDARTDLDLQGRDDLYVRVAYVHACIHVLVCVWGCVCE